MGHDEINLGVLFGDQVEIGYFLRMVKHGYCQFSDDVEHLASGKSMQFEAFKTKGFDFVPQKSLDSTGFRLWIMFGETNELFRIAPADPGNLQVGFFVLVIVDRKEDGPIDPRLGQD